MEERVSFASDSLELAGVLHVPDGRAARERRPGFLVLHGFGSNKNSGVSVAVAKILADFGYVALRFDMQHVHIHGQRRGRQDRAASASAAAPRARFRHPDGAVDRSVRARRPADGPAPRRGPRPFHALGEQSAGRHARVSLA